MAKLIPDRAIEIAQAAGWKERFGDSRWSDNTNQVKMWNCEAIALDPLFFQALGKALGWKTSPFVHADTDRPLPEWYAKAFNLYDLILIGGSLDKFWEDVLK